MAGALDHELRQEFLFLANQSGSNFSRLCQRFGISRKTGYNGASDIDRAVTKGWRSFAATAAVAAAKRAGAGAASAVCSRPDWLGRT